jgi:hypothetical protein
MQTDKGMKLFLRKGQMGAWREHFSPEVPRYIHT